MVLMVERGDRVVMTLMNAATDPQNSNPFSRGRVNKTNNSKLNRADRSI